MNRIIDSVLDNDLYKISMMQAVYHQYPEAYVTYAFTCRNKDIKLGFLADQVREQIAMMASVRLRTSEALCLGNLEYMSVDFIKWLSGKHLFIPNNVTVKDKDGDLEILLAGKWLDTILWEVPLLAVVNELYFKSQPPGVGNSMESARRLLQAKKDKLRDYPNIKIAEFGTRRRYSKDWHHDKVAPALFKDSNLNNFIGSSNMKVAMDNMVTPIGTVAHEWTMAHLGLTDRTEQAQKRALHVWQQEFGQGLGIALTDTFTTDVFFRDFDFPLAWAYDGIRQDSGCPYEFTEKAVRHYESIGIDPHRKTVIYSDGLTVDKCIDLWKTFAGRIDMAFGVGTNLTNDIPGLKPLNIVIKMTSCNGIPVVKLSDEKGKEMGSVDKIKEVKQAYGVS